MIKNENTPDPLAEVNITALCTYWDDIRSLAHNTLPTGDDIRRMLAACGAPVSLHDIGIPESLSSDLYAYAPHVRHRLTLMRLEKLIEK